MTKLRSDHDVQPAGVSVQDRDAAKPLLWNLRKAFPSVKLAWADGGYAGKLITWAAARLKPKLNSPPRPLAHRRPASRNLSSQAGSRSLGLRCGRRKDPAASRTSR